MDKIKQDEIRQSVAEQYGNIAKAVSGSCCGPSSCCGSEGVSASDTISRVLGYSKDEVSNVPDGANMGLGCGNPQAIAALKPGETVVDLGSGGGFDCFLAAQAVGEMGRVIGIDMTPSMISKARQNTETSGQKNVEFRLGEIEHLPVADESVDVIISNCVINLSPAKELVYKDAFRVLKSGGRLAIADVVATVDIPVELQEDMRLLGSCISGASKVNEIETMLKGAGFVDIRIEPKDESRQFIKDWNDKDKTEFKIEDMILSASIEAVKP